MFFFKKKYSSRSEKRKKKKIIEQLTQSQKAILNKFIMKETQVEDEQTDGANENLLKCIFFNGILYFNINV